jgi:hypothetical protein
MNNNSFAGKQVSWETPLPVFPPTPESEEGHRRIFPPETGNLAGAILT